MYRERLVLSFGSGNNHSLFLPPLVRTHFLKKFEGGNFRISTLFSPLASCLIPVKDTSRRANSMVSPLLRALAMIVLKSSFVSTAPLVFVVFPIITLASSVDQLDYDASLNSQKLQVRFSCLSPPPLHTPSNFFRHIDKHTHELTSQSKTQNEPYL
ncbi:hypothetical protein D3C73_1364380 [compost metagenome]